MIFLLKLAIFGILHLLRSETMIEYIKKNIQKIVKFSLGGFINYFLKLGLTIILIEKLKLYYLYSYIISLLIIVLFTFFYNSFITFSRKKNKRRNFVFYSIFYFLFMFFDFFLVKTLTDFLGFNYKLSITFSTFIIFCLKFLVYDFIIFRKV